MARRRRKKDTRCNDESRASRGKDRDLTLASTVKLMIQVVALVRVIIDFLGH